MNKDIIIDIIMVIILIGAIGYLVYLTVSTNIDAKESMDKVNDKLSKMDFSPTYDVIGEITDLGRKFSNSHQYNSSYNCVNFSEDFNGVLNNLGYRSHTVSGCEFGNISACHRWVRIELDFEPIYGDFVNYDGEYEER